MPSPCCVTGCSSGYRSNDEKVSPFCFPSGTELQKWRRAIPRKEVGAFSFESPNVHDCEKHFDTADIACYDAFVVNREVDSLRAEQLKLKPDAIFRIFEGLPRYLTKTKSRSRPPAKRRHVSHQMPPQQRTLPITRARLPGHRRRY